MPTSDTIAAIDGHWASEYGLPVECLGRAGRLRAPLAGPADWAGLFIFSRGDLVVVQGPPGHEAAIDAWLAAEPGANWLDPVGWQGRLGIRLERTIGPAWLGYADGTDFKPSEELGARALHGGDRPALDELATAVGPLAWEHSGISPEHPPLYGCFIDDRLVAAGTVERWGDRLQHVGIVTHPDWRGRGLGRAVVSFASRRGLEKGGIMQYRTLGANTPSVAIATRLGFWPYAATLAVRLC